VSKSHTIISGGIILVLASFINSILLHFQLDNTFTGFVGSIVILVVATFVMGKVANNILTFFKELDQKESAKNEG
jgi:xanthine/uracil permease